KIYQPYRAAFFLSYNEDTTSYEMYCWSMVYGPTVAEDINIESQFWHVTPNHAGFRFQLRHRIAHSRLTGGVAFAMGHRLDLSSQNLNLRALSKFPGFTPVALYDDILASYQALTTINDFNFNALTMEQTTSFLGVTTPVVNPNPSVNPELLAQTNSVHGHFHIQPDPNMRQASSSTGVAGVEVTTPNSGVPVQSLATPPTLTETGSVSSDEVDMKMHVGDITPTGAEVKAFTTNFRKNGPGKGARVVICLHCLPNSARRRITNPRPWNLARHLMSHFRKNSEK
ncbi:hypothetical protein FRC11_002640, partial [Ceratobasidium sp. 423]